MGSLEMVAPFPDEPVELVFLGTGTSSSVPHVDCLTAPPDAKPCKTCLSTLYPEGKKNIRVRLIDPLGPSSLTRLCRGIPPRSFASEAAMGRSGECTPCSRRGIVSLTPAYADQHYCHRCWQKLPGVRHRVVP